MNLKKLFKAMFALVLGIVVLVSCDPTQTPGPEPVVKPEPDTVPTTGKPSYVETDQVYLYGNCKESDMSASVFGFGDAKRHTFGGASLLSMEDLLKHGYYIVGIRVYIGAEVETGKVFIGADYNNPEVSKDFSYKQGGWQYILFDQPYDFKQDVYIGFEATGTTDFLALEQAKKTIKTEMMYIDGTWDLVNNQVGRYVWSIQAIVVGGDYSSERQHDVVLERATVSKNPKAGDDVIVSCELRGAGIVPVENVTVKCTLGGETKTVNVSEKLMNGQSILVNFEGLTAPAVDGGFENINVELEADYADDVLNSNNKSEATLCVYSADAVERNMMLIEQFTGQDCGYCPGGAETLKLAIAGMKTPEKVIWVAHHYGYRADAFTLGESEVIGMALGVQGAPNCAVNRMSVDFAPGQSGLCWHPGYSTTALLEELVATPGLATIELNRSFNVADSTLTVEVKGKSLMDVANVTVLVKQSGIVARQASGGNDYKHNNAPRAFLTDAKGDVLTLENGNYTATYTYKVPTKVGDFACVLEDMEVVAFVHGDLAKSSSRLVYNAVQVPVLETQAQNVMRAMSLYNNYNTDLRSLSEQICY